MFAKRLSYGSDARTQVCAASRQTPTFPLSPFPPSHDALRRHRRHRRQRRPPRRPEEGRAARFAHQGAGAAAPVCERRGAADHAGSGRAPRRHPRRCAPAAADARAQRLPGAGRPLLCADAQGDGPRLCLLCLDEPAATGPPLSPGALRRGGRKLLDRHVRPRLGGAGGARGAEPDAARGHGHRPPHARVCPLAGPRAAGGTGRCRAGDLSGCRRTAQADAVHDRLAGGAGAQARTSSSRWLLHAGQRTRRWLRRHFRAATRPDRQDRGRPGAKHGAGQPQPGLSGIALPAPLRAAAEKIEAILRAR